LVERPVAGRGSGLSEATLRLKFSLTEAEVRRELARAFAKLFDLYTNATFEVTVSANAILRGPPERPTFSLYFGADYASDGQRSVRMGPIYTVGDLGEVSNLPATLAQADFERVFDRTFESTGVTVFGLASLIYIIRKSLSDFDRDRKTEGRSHLLLY
jgi:hypothetical protein